jgi:hypothetical protein
MPDTPAPDVTVTLTFSARTAARLGALVDSDLADPAWTPGQRLRAVLMELADHAQQAVYRPGAWEREWICQAFGYSWQANLEPDPEHLDIGWQRPRGSGG